MQRNGAGRSHWPCPPAARPRTGRRRRARRWAGGCDALNRRRGAQGARGARGGAPPRLGAGCGLWRPARSREIGHRQNMGALYNARARGEHRQALGGAGTGEHKRAGARPWGTHVQQAGEAGAAARGGAAPPGSVVKSLSGRGLRPDCYADRWEATARAARAGARRCKWRRRRGPGKASGARRMVRRDAASYSGQRGEVKETARGTACLLWGLGITRRRAAAPCYCAAWGIGVARARAGDAVPAAAGGGRAPRRAAGKAGCGVQRDQGMGSLEFRHDK